MGSFWTIAALLRHWFDWAYWRFLKRKKKKKKKKKFCLAGTE